MESQATQSSNLEVGAIIGGCRILKEIARGGMGTIYEAEQISLQRKVAIKVLRSADDPGQKEAQWRLLEEARLAAKVNHPNIVQIHEAGEERGIPYAVLEHVEGVTLRDILRGQAVLPLKKLHRVAVQVSRGLAAAHREKIVHRDIKPENILLTSLGEVKIADFGIAGTFFREQKPEEGHLGTPAYASPEMIRKEPSDGKADVYSLGILLYTAAAGAHPFPIQDKPALLRAQMEKIPKPLGTLRPGMAQGFASLIDRMCAKRPLDRPSSEEVLAGLEGHPEWAEEGEGERKAEAVPKDGEGIPGVKGGTPEGSKKPSILNATFKADRKGSQAPPSEFNLKPAFKPKKEEIRIFGAEPAAPPVGPSGEEAVRGDPAPAAANNARLDELCIQGRFHLLKKDWKKAEEKFREALSVDPLSAAALLGLARVLLEMSRPDEAAAMVRKAVESGKIEAKQVLEMPHFQRLRDSKEFRRLLVEKSL